MELTVPNDLTDIQAINFLQKIDHYKDSRDLTINHSGISFVLPFGTLLLAIGVRNIVNYRKRNGLTTKSIGHDISAKAVTYLQHVGFFKFVGLKEGKDVGEACGSNNYIPIRRISNIQYDKSKEMLQDAIDREANELAKILYPLQKDESSVLMLSYCLREVIRNVFEHANTDECFLFAQKWKTGYAEIAIADEGIGFKKSLSRVFTVESSEDAINKALEPGISSDTSAPSDNKWQNSGFGLYVISELGRIFGRFSVASDNAVLMTDGESKIWNHVPVFGTVVKLHINTGDADYFPNILHNIVEEGEKKALTIPGAKISASKMSKIAKLISR